MLKDYQPSEEAKSLALQALQNFEEATDKEAIKARLRSMLYGYLTSASELEHLLSMQYLFSAFSLKKYPEEFNEFIPEGSGALSADAKQQNNVVHQKLEVIRRWEAKILYVARQEMEHLNLVQNLAAILGEPPYLDRPNFPASKTQNALGEIIELLPFSEYAVEVFRYWEKPDHLHLQPPQKSGASDSSANAKVSKIPFELEPTVLNSWEEIIKLIKNEPLPLKKDWKESIEELYTFVNVYFYFMLKFEVIEGSNINRIVEEHFGFNITLDSIVEGKYLKYVNEVIEQILIEGEGVHGVPPSLDSHFMVFQQILDEIKEMKEDGILNAALPVVENPCIGQSEANAANDSESTPVTNEIAIEAMKLFNRANQFLNQILYGFFAEYSYDYTTNIRPPDTNAFFRTSFYPFMTMVIRPLGEMICRLPALAGEKSNVNSVPTKTAGPDFHVKPLKPYTRPDVSIPPEKDPFLLDAMEELEEMSESAYILSRNCKNDEYHMANANSPDARDFDVRFRYLGENLKRISQNFYCYWTGKIIAPIPSKNFQNFSDTFN